MMKVKAYLLSCSLCLLMQPSLHAQQNKTGDSLLATIQHTPHDSVRVTLYYDYGKQFETSAPDTAWRYYQKAKDLAHRVQYTRGIAMYASHAIVILNNQGKFREALALTQEALPLYVSIGNKRDLAIAYLNIGSEWHYLADFKVAAEQYLKALTLAEEIADQQLQRILNNNLASIFIDLQDYTKGKAYAERSLVFARAMKNDYAISSSMVNIAVAELLLKHYDTALEYYQAIEAIGTRTDDYIVLLDGQLGMADVYNATMKMPDAENAYKKVIMLSQQKLAQEYEMYAYMGMGDLYSKLHRDGEAQKILLKGVSLAQDLGSSNELKDLYLKISQLHERRNAFELALDFRKKFEVLNDSITGEKSKIHVNLLEAKFESGKKEATIQQLETSRQIQELTIRQQNQLNYIFGGVAIAVVIIASLFYRNHRQQQNIQEERITKLETEKQLLATEAVMKGEEQERARLAKDLHDGLGGMLSGLKYALNSVRGNLIMSSENQRSFERSIDMLDNSIREMRRVAHNMMPETLVQFGLDVAMRDFCHDITQSGALTITYQSIGLGNVDVGQTLAITIYRIVQELINNTLKHAEAVTSVVQVTKSDTHIQITVEDDGKGFDVAALQQSTGIGWSNIRHRVEFLKGRLDVRSNAKEGTSVVIEFDV